MADQSLGIGKLFGIEIKLHWTFILILLIALLFGIFTFIVILFTMVLLHELAHSLTSKHYNIKVKKIILTPLGGMSVIDLDGVKPQTSARIAAAGPLASIALSVIFGLLYLYFPSGVVGIFLELLFLINIILGVGNILPAFPLDGGRVLKSYYEEKYDQLTATKKTVTISKIILVLYLIVSTIYVLILPNLSTSTFLLLILWNVIIAMFIYGGAQSELEMAYASKYSEKLYVRNAASKDCLVVSPKTTLKQLYRILLKKGAKPALFSLNGAVYMVSDIASSPRSRKESRFLTQKVTNFSIEIPKIGMNERLSKAIEKMRYEESGIMAAMNGSKIAGILLADHVESILALHMRSSNADLRN